MKQGVYGIFEVFMDSIVICTLTSLAVLMGLYAKDGVAYTPDGAGPDQVVEAFSSIFSDKLAALIIAVALSLFALSTILSWALYGSRCVEFLFGKAARPATMVYKVIFCVVLIVGSTLGLEIVWQLGDALNGLMAIPNLIALLLLSGMIIKITKNHFADK